MSNDDTIAILEFLRVRFGRVDETLARIIERQIKLGRVERLVADLHAQGAEQSIRMDRVSQQIERLERRLDQIEASP